MSNNSLNPLRADHAAGAYLGDEPPDLGPLRAVAERTELAEAVARLADGYGRRHHRRGDDAMLTSMAGRGQVAAWPRTAGSG